MSSIIYEPRLAFNLAAVLGGAFVRTVTRAAADFIAQQNKPWEFYLGVYAGNVAAATGIVGAAATLYLIGDTLDAVVFKSPDGGSLRLFLNGVQVTTIDTYAATAVWETVQMSLVPGVRNRVDFVNDVNNNPSKTSSINWMALSLITVTGDNPQVQRSSAMAYNTMAFRLRDAEADTQLATLPIYLPTGSTLAEYQVYANAVAPEIDAATGSVIAGIDILINLDLPAGLKATPTANINNERGGLISFLTTGPRPDSVRIPGILPSIMPGDSFSLTQPQIAALITRLTTATTAGNIRPVTFQEYQFTVAQKAVRSRRKQ